MYIELNTIYFILALAGCAAVVYLIIVLRNFNKLIKQSNEILSDNKDSIKEAIDDLPKLVTNISDASENIKDVSEVVTDVTADFIVAKDNVKSNLEIATEILNIVRTVFGK